MPILQKLREAIARWLCPEMASAHLGQRAAFDLIKESQLWLTEFAVVGPVLARIMEQVDRRIRMRDKAAILGDPQWPVDIEDFRNLLRQHHAREVEVYHIEHTNKLVSDLSRLSMVLHQARKQGDTNTYNVFSKHLLDIILANDAVIMSALRNLSPEETSSDSCPPSNPESAIRSIPLDCGGRLILMLDREAPRYITYLREDVACEPSEIKGQCFVEELRATDDGRFVGLNIHGLGE